MSDYEDEYEDYDADFFYVEDEYMAADDLAEHAVASPPPATCGDEDMEDDWDRFDYFNDLEYASDGYDDTTFQPLDVKGAKTDSKRKRVMRGRPGNKMGMRNAKTNTDARTKPAAPGHSPIVWRSQADRGIKLKMLEDNAQPYALFKNWREKLTDTPDWAKGSPPNSPGASSLLSEKEKGSKTFVTEPASTPYDEDEEEDNDEPISEKGHAVSQEALLAALQRQLAAAGGPLSGMDPQQLLDFAMRMAADQDAGDDIAGEMADAILAGDDEEDSENTEEKLLSWVSQQRNGTREDVQDSPSASKPPPTPPSSSTYHSAGTSQPSTAPCIATPNETPTAASHPPPKPSRKRKADTEPTTTTTTTTKKRATVRSFDAPTAASQARAAPPSKPTTRSRSGRKA